VADDFPRVDADTTLTLTLVDEARDVEVLLHYKVCYEEDVILRSTGVVNHSDETVTIDRLMSCSLDLEEDYSDLISFTGDWIRERHLQREPLARGRKVLTSTLGVSGAQVNPGILLAGAGTDETHGSCLGINLLYSGNFECTVEKTASGLIRLQEGVETTTFSYPLAPGESILSPEVALTFSDGGFDGLSRRFHRFVGDRVIPAPFRKKERPIVFNTWEGMYFDFDQRKLLRFARQGKALGLECMVLDDGWFQNRGDDIGGLGDWKEDPAKLPGGLEALSEQIHGLGLQFGLWVEPEMISTDTALYRDHPDWAVADDRYGPTPGRNQFVLNLGLEAVQDHLFDAIDDLIRRGKLDYLKWDMNRPITDVSRAKGTFYWTYYRGLYRLLRRIVAAHPDLLIETCASGGSRFDLGMLFFSPQIWTSDNTDPHERMKIQHGTSYFYPQSTMGAHVGSDPNHQLLRRNSLENRFNVATFGVLGYELNLLNLSTFEKKVIARQVAFYKAHRALLQFGTFSRIQSPFDGETIQWQVKTDDTCLVFYGIGKSQPGSGRRRLRFRDLASGRAYRIENRVQVFNIADFGELINHVSPVKLKTTGPLGLLHKSVSEHYLFESETFRIEAHGGELMSPGLMLPQTFNGTGYTDQMMHLGDFGSRLFVAKGE
jgi:alpha-galactosidase